MPYYSSLSHHVYRKLFSGAGEGAGAGAGARARERVRDGAGAGAGAGEGYRLEQISEILEFFCILCFRLHYHFKMDQLQHLK